KRLAPRRNNNVIMLADRSRERFSPMELQGLEFQGIQGNEHVLRPLIAVAPLSGADVDKKVLQPRRPDDAVFAPKLLRSSISALRKRSSLSLRAPVNKQAGQDQEK